ncbi:MAG: MoxR family ATPase [Oscillospiraceae bacterium]|nr:MoxR family ATPase [Oscillospiraceae bacterium]
MNLSIKLTQNALKEFLLNVAVIRPIFIWGAPGIGKSSLVGQFASEIGMECVSLLGSQLAPEDIIGVPQIVDGCSKFFPPKMIVKDKPYVLFNEIHPYVIEYITIRPDHLWSKPPKTEETFSTPRSWHMLSDALKEYGEKLSDKDIEVLCAGTLTPSHAIQFRAFIKQLKNKYKINSIIQGEERWPSKPEDRDILYFLAQSFRAHLLKNLPSDKEKCSAKDKDLIFLSKACIKDLANISFEIAQMVVADDDGQNLPGYFLLEIVRDLPRLVQREKNK